MANVNKVIRTRIAPSPTGNLHVGLARTVLFNELFAHQQAGRFILRIEDTDKERSKSSFEKNIIEGLTWLGLKWDEGPDIGGDMGPYRQSDRGDYYKKAIEQLLSSGRAYQDEQAVKLKVEAGEVEFEDLIRGKVVTHTDNWGGDFVIARSMEDPVFHLAVVVDDAAMNITHVIRGEDHISNTARHILIQRALGLPQPQYAHLPLLLDEKRRKLSKRAGEVDLLAYRDRGYLPQAVLNYLALLGWNPKDDTEYFTYEELLEKFSLSGVQKAGAIFSEQKLQSINKHYLKKLTPEEFLEIAEPFLAQEGYVIDDEQYWAAAVATEQERVANLKELPEKMQYFKQDWQISGDPNILVWKKSTPQKTLDIIKRLMDFMSSLEDNQFNEEELEKNIMPWIDETGQGRGDVLWPLRVAMTGLDKSPGPFEIASILGKQETLDRLNKAYDWLAKNT